MEMICGWHVANSIIKKSREEMVLITPIKLYYLVYLVYSNYLYKNNIKLFNESFIKTEIGPILPSVYHKFNSFKNSTINLFAKDAKNIVYIIREDSFKETLNYIWDKYKYLNEIEILNYINYNNYYQLNFNQDICDEIIIEDERNRNDKVYKKILDC